MALIDRTQHPLLNDNLDFRKDLAKVLKKYNAEIVSEHDEDLSFIIKGVGCYLLNEKDHCCANADNINGLEQEKPKREKKRKVKNALRRWIYEYSRYNPQLGTSTRKDEVYAKTRNEAARTAKRHCDAYTAYGYLTFKRLIQVSDPIVEGLDVEPTTKRYGEYPKEKTYNEFRDKYPQQHSDGWDNLHDITETD